MKKRDELVKNYVDSYINYVNTAYDLYKAKKAIDDFDSGDATNSSESDVEPTMKSTEMWDEEKQEFVYISRKELFEYYVVDALSGHRAIGVVQAADINEATEIMKNSIKPNHFCVTHVHKLEFNDKGFCDIYDGF